MATYSTNLALTLLATGEGAGTWGNTTNTNLGTLLEQAISGYATESLTAGTTLTLTIPNGATGVARNMYLEFTGNGSTVIVPSNKKLYFVYNNCSSGTITFKVDGQTGVSIPKGSKQILVSNGTDVQQAVTPAPTGTTNTSITALGINAGTALTSGSANVTMGYNAGTAITTGFGLTVIGHNAGASLTSSLYTTAVGAEAGGLYSQSENNYFGYAAGRNINSGSNCAFGFLSVRGLPGSSTGTGNAGFGNETLSNVTTGNVNTVIGNYAGDVISTGSYNSVVGYAAGGAITTGSANTLIGYSAGGGISTGNNNAALGDTAYSSGNYSNSTCIGYSSSVTGSNQVQLGNSSTTSYAYGAVQDRSDERDKADIQDTQLGLDFIMALRPRDFKWDMREDYRTDPPVKPSRADYADEAAYNAAIAQWQADYANWETANSLANLTHDGTHKRSRYHHGLIAQEVKQTMDAMGVDFGGYQDHTIKGGDAVLTIGYEELVAPLIKAIQELKAEFDEYKRTHP